LLIPLLLVLAICGFSLSLVGLQSALFAAGFKVFAMLACIFHQDFEFGA
jgi:uncharacterized membrane protein